MKSRILGLVVFSASSGFAQVVWNGAGTNDNWSTGANWQGGVGPANNGTAAVQFGGTTRRDPIVDTAWSISSLTFAPGAGTFRLMGSPLTIGAGGVTNNSGVTQGIGRETAQSTAGIQIILGASQTWDATADISVYGRISGAATLTKTGAGTLHLRGNHTYSGGTVISAGAIRLGGSSDGVGTIMGNVSVLGELISGPSATKHSMASSREPVRSASTRLPVPWC